MLNLEVLSRSMRYCSIILLCLFCSLNVGAQEDSFTSYTWLTELIDSIKNETTLCADCPQYPEIKSYLSSGQQRFRLRYACTATTNSTIYYNADGSIFGVCIVGDNFRDCTDVSAYTSYTFGSNITTFWSCTAGTVCEEEKRLNLYQEYEILVVDDACDPTQKELSISASFVSQTWTIPDGQTLSAPSIKAVESGMYRLVVYNENDCPDTSEILINLNQPSLPQIQGSSVICDATGTELSLPGYATYLWSDGSTDGSTTVHEGGITSVTITDENQCESTAEIEIVDLTNRNVTIQTDHQDIYKNQNVLFNYKLSEDAESDDIVDVVWIVNGKGIDALGEQISVQLQGPSSIRVELLTVEGCLLVDELFVEPKAVSKEYYAPNIFNPLSQQGNTHFTIHAPQGTILLNKLVVFDRWGGSIFQKLNMPTNSLQDGWDGYLNGTLAPIGVYTYLAEMTLLDGSKQVITGSLFLIY